jgi:transposase
MPGPKRARRERTEEWASIKQWTLWPEQELYEQIRPIILFGQTAGERAKETNAAQRTLSRKADEFERYGMRSWFSDHVPREEAETARSLPLDMRQLIVDLHAELPTMSWREIADICYVRTGRKPSHHSIKHIATSGLSPSLTGRRYQPWHLIPDPAECRLAVIRLHAEGWRVASIAEYLQTSRHTIYATLQRWTEEGVAGLEEKSKARKGPRKVTLQISNEIRKLQENPLLGKFRVHTALLREGIEVSPATCARIMAKNRKLYGLPPPKRGGHPKLEMPFKASRRHEYWSIDVRYIEEHLLEDPKPVYVITVFENFSRTILSSKISTTQNQWDYLSVLADALRRYGAPEAIVTDGGGIFYSTQALQLYDMLGIRKERIEAGKPWQNYAETLFSIQRRMADYGFSHARTWPEMLSEHQQWWDHYNREHHFAHRARQDGRHSPQEVLRGVLGRTYPEEVLSRVLFATQFTRHLDKHGYVRFRNWRFFGEDGLAGEEVSVWVYEETLKVEYQTTALSLYSLTFQPDHEQIAEVTQARRIQTPFRSPQLDLWQLSETEWLLALRRPDPVPRRNRGKIITLARQLPLLDVSATG